MTNNYHSLTKKEVFSKIKSSEEGLTTKEAEKRLKKYGKNELEKKKSFSAIKILLKQFKEPLVLILIAAIIISALVHEYIDAGVIGIILVVNAAIGFSQEYKAEKSIALLKKIATYNAKVIRDGEEHIIDAKDLVIGDVIIVEAGDKIPADCRLLSVTELNVNESMLTGESMPIKKSPGVIVKKSVLAEQKNMIFSGTIATNGKAKAIVIATGMNTELGKIAELVQSVERASTPLQLRLKKLSKKIGIIVLVIAALITFVGIAEGLEWTNILITAISLAVSAIPEGLPAVVTIALAIGVQRMLKKKSLIRDLQSVETLGSVTVICSDKTGTITKNEMTVTDIYTNNKSIKVSGSGYETKGNFTLNNKKYSTDNIKMLLRIAASCNNATLEFGDPTEIALLVAAKKASIEKEARLDEVPFDSVKKYMITKHKKGYSYIKGAPEKVIKMCDYILINGSIKKLTKKGKEKILEENKNMAEKALRVLAMAYKHKDKTIFTGLMGMIDPPREEVKNALKLAKKAGIRVMMITGDNAITAKAIANKVGLKGNVSEGKDIDHLTHAELRKLVKKITIFARVDPEHKLKILKALQANDEIVAMTGDGVNDAPALKGANVGISMAIKGTDVARESSEMVLTDDNFASIVAAIKEGRVIYDNIKKFVVYLLTVNFSEIALVLTSMLFGFPLPLLALQILWINLVTDSLPALALGVDKAEKNVMDRKPRKTNETILHGYHWFLVIGGCLAFITGLIAFFYGRAFDIANGINLWNFSIASKARTMAFTTSIMFEMFFVFTMQSLKEPLHKRGFFENKWLVGAVLISVLLHIIMMYSPLANVFSVVTLDILDWLVVIVLSISGLALFELKKIFE